MCACRSLASIVCQHGLSDFIESVHLINDISLFKLALHAHFVNNEMEIPTDVLVFFQSQHEQHCHQGDKDVPNLQYPRFVFHKILLHFESYVFAYREAFPPAI